MITLDDPPRPRDPSPDPTIHLAISQVTLSPEGGPSIDFTLSASSLLNPSAGYQLWSEDPDGTPYRHSSTKNNAELHIQPFRTRRWWAHVVPHAPGQMRFFAAREWENPRRASDYVVVALPPLPAPTEFAVRDGGLKVVATGRVRPSGAVCFSVAGQSTTVTSMKDGRWTAVLDAPKGPHVAAAVALGGVLGDSPPVTASVTVAAPPNIPLLLQFPEDGRKITRLTRVTGSATPRSNITVSLGGGPMATTQAAAGGAWSIAEVRSDQSGDLLLHVENLSTGEVLQRPVNVAYFPEWQVSHLYAGPLINEGGLISRLGAIAEGTGEQADIIEFSKDGRDPWAELAHVDDKGRWRFEHLASPPPPPFRMGRLYLRSVGDPLQQQHTVEIQAPIIIEPAEGDATGAMPVFSGTAVGPFKIELPDGTTQSVAVETDKTWRLALGPFTPGLHTIIARSTTHSEREITRRTILVLEDKPVEAPAGGGDE